MALFFLLLISSMSWVFVSLSPKPNSVFVFCFLIDFKLSSFIYFLKLIYLIYLFLAALGLRCCARVFSSCGERGLLFVAVRRLLIAVASLVAEHGL